MSGTLDLQRGDLLVRLVRKGDYVFANVQLEGRLVGETAGFTLGQCAIEEVGEPSEVRLWVGPLALWLWRHEQPAVEALMTIDAVAVVATQHSPSLH